MRKVLIVCSTPLMLINTINLSMCWDFNSIEADIILTDESSGMNQYADNLRKLGIFRKVFFAEVQKNNRGGNLLKKIRKSFYVFDKNLKFDMEREICSRHYDDFYFCIYDILSNQIFNIIKKGNDDLVTHRYEEGYSNYVTSNDIRNLSFFLHFMKIFNGKILEDCTDEYLLYHPDWLPYSVTSKLIEIPVLDNKNKELIDRLNSIFGYKNEAMLFSKKFIFFEESFSATMKSFDDIKIMKLLAAMVGEDNIQIKSHPRIDSKRLINNGFNVVQCDLPWEILWLNGDFNDTTLVSISSGSIVNLFSWGIQAHKAILLYNLLSQKPPICNDNYERYINKAIEDSNIMYAYLPRDNSQLKKAVQGN